MPTGFPTDFVGLVSDDTFLGNAAHDERTLSTEAGIGVTLLRREFDWALIEATQGVYTFDKYDKIVGQSAKHGLHLLPILFDPPGFASARPSSHAREGTYPPKRAQDLANLGVALIKRYGPQGTFWDQHPEIPKLPIHSWQIWNEPNLPVYWASGPNPRQYAQLLVTVRHAMKQSDPSAEIVTAGLPDSKLGINWLTYLNGMYRAGARAGFDTLAVNPYASDAQTLVGKLRAVRAVMKHHGDANQPLWLTELGWADKGAGRSPFKVGAAGQATRVAQLLRAIRSLRTPLHLRGFVYYAWKDSRPYAPHYTDFWGLHTGLLNLGDQPKQAYFSFIRGVAALGKSPGTAPGRVLP